MQTSDDEGDQKQHAYDGRNADSVYKELAANMIPNSYVVATDILAVTRAQECGYVLQTAL